MSFTLVTYTDKLTGTKQVLRPHKYPRTNHWTTSMGLQSDDRICAWSENIAKKEVVITEKLDGANVCLFNGEVYGRAISEPSHAGWMAMVRKNHGYKTFGETNYAFYGEDIYGIHSIEYDSVKDTFFLFAVSDGNNFLSWDEVETIARVFDMQTVPLLYRGKSNIKLLNKTIERLVSSESQIGGEIEGVVIRNPSSYPVDDHHKHVAKWVRFGHVQTDQHWTRNWRPCKISR